MLILPAVMTPEVNSCAEVVMMARVVDSCEEVVMVTFDVEAESCDVVII